MELYFEQVLLILFDAQKKNIGTLYCNLIPYQELQLRCDFEADYEKISFRSV